MDKLARLSAKDRRDIFAEAAARRGIRPTIIEKDFWVCIVLKLLFHRSRFAESLVFKGGTSLSKAYGLIERFSEDIDLVLDWNVIGFGEGLRDPLQDFDSKSKQDRFNKEINNLAAMYIAQTLCPELNDLLQRKKWVFQPLWIRMIHMPSVFGTPRHFQKPIFDPKSAWK
jgi:hypothetical protein